MLPDVFIFNNFIAKDWLIKLCKGRGLQLDIGENCDNVFVGQTNIKLFYEKSGKKKINKFVNSLSEYCIKENLPTKKLCGHDIIKDDTTKELIKVPKYTKLADDRVVLKYITPYERQRIYYTTIKNI